MSGDWLGAFFIFAIMFTFVSPALIKRDYVCVFALLSTVACAFEHMYMFVHKCVCV